MKRLTKNLIENSIEAFILALETVNRPSLRYRTEAFCFLFCNSWELLMKAKILNDGRKIFHKKKRKQPRRSLSLDECLNYCFMFENDPIKLNIEKISELRNNAMHLVIPFVPRGIMGLFQAGVINYPRELEKWFGVILSDKVPLGMMALIYDFDPREHLLEYPQMKRKYPAETVRWLVNFQQNLRNQATELDNNLQFYIPIEYKLAIVKNPGKADIVLSAGGTGMEALVLEVTKNVDRTHPYRATEAAQMVAKKLDGEPAVTIYDIQCIREIYNIEHRAEFYHTSRYSPRQYSEKFIEWVVSKAAGNADFFNQIRYKARVKRGELLKKG